MNSAARTLSSVVVVFAATLWCCPASAQRAEVIDGDTIRVAGVVVRMMGLDAPERRARCPAEARLAARATARLRQLVRPRVWLERRGRDRYRRTLAVVRDGAGRDLAQVMIREGLARPYNGQGQREGWC
ncbi:thermonuclease family protein [Falsiroseomonas sp. E2-1-a20]|uniref:thermonuclease family protein n=1 Tax=Falsiroseomonas sp. E2-1-a20 TaxID=3239300 RepID=UPI003F3538C4